MLIEADRFWHMIVRGRVEPWRPGSHRQNEIVVQAVGATAAEFAAGGYPVVLDGIVGPWFLDLAIASARRRNVTVHYLVLRPDEATAVTRATGRTHPDALTDEVPVRQMWAAFTALGPYEGHVIDPTALTPDETVDAVRHALREERLRLAIAGDGG